LAKSFELSKHAVWDAYLAVKANKGAAGIDGQTMEDFEADLKNNLYKIWNRLSSGSYFPPPVRRVEIPKSNGKLRPLGIPTISDRIAQMVIKNRLEPLVEPRFHDDSYGYRPGKSALDAIAQTRQRCWRDDWVLDMDIKRFFDALDHGLVMKAVAKYTDCQWTLLYIERWLRADVIMTNGERIGRDRGTPQGGVISPLLANIFLHLVFDKWMQTHFPCIHFERYADDIVVHCRSEAQLKMVERQIRQRLTRCGLELCQEKTKIVYCKDSSRDGQYPIQSFDFLGYTFRPRSARDRNGKFFVSFSPAVSRKALKAMRAKLKGHPLIKAGYSQSVVELAKTINPIIQGWITYYGKFRKSAMSAIYSYINEKLLNWARRKFKSLQRRKWRASQWLRELYRQCPTLFAHWRVWSWVAG
jgi:RNA-directed DNA polymerase